MPRFKQKGTLERSAAADLFKHTLSRIPTTYGRLVYLASLRDPNSGIYRHHGLTITFGREEGTRAMREGHQSVFQGWLAFSLHDKYEDLLTYLHSLEDPISQVLDHWKQTRIYVSFVPELARESEKLLFEKEMEALLGLLRAGLSPADGGAPPDPGSSQPG